MVFIQISVHLFPSCKTYNTIEGGVVLTNDTQLFNKLNKLQKHDRRDEMPKKG